MFDIRYFGIDATEARNAKLISINKRLLELKKQENSSNRLEYTGITKFVKDEDTGENIELAYLKIIDNNKFSEFIWGLTYIKATKEVIPYTRIKASINSFEDAGEKRGNNFKSLSIIEYRIFMIQIKDYLHEEYGVLIDISDVEFEYLELANTFSLREEYKRYSDVLKAMYMFSPEAMKKIEKDKKKEAHGLHYDKGAEFIETMEIGNASIGFIAYNKTLQMMKYYNMDVEFDAMRIELRIKSGTRASQIFDNKNIWEITDEELVECYLHRFEKDLVKGINGYIKKSNIELKKLMKGEKENNSRLWTQKLLTKSMGLDFKYSDSKGNIVKKDIRLVFDIGQVLEIMKKEMKRKSVYDKAVQRMKRDIDCYEDKKNNLIRLNEIIEKNSFE